MSDPLFLLLKYRNSWRHFENPTEVFIVHKLQDLQNTLKKLDEFIQSGKFVAGFMCYEASHGIDDALIAEDLKDFPYAVFGVYENFKTLKALPGSGENYKIDNWLPSQTKQAYCSNIAKIKEYIARGDTYQVNYTIRLNSTFTGEPFSFFRNLVELQQSDFAAYVNFQNFSICSASPELFFELDGDKIISRPMKGTAGRGLSYIDDIAQRDKLKSSEKEQAENLMIVDMIRNDLGKICKSDSIKVINMFQTTRYPTIWQMTSDVHGKTDASCSEILNALFPCASITGAPKAKTTRIISELEGRPRKIYTGSIGYFGPGRKALFNVAIRTVLIDRETNQAEYGVGSGIVWDSIDANEYEECRVKAKILSSYKIEFNLLETMLASPTVGIFLLDYHLSRLKQSAEYFNYPFDEKKLKQKLDHEVECISQHAKIRLLLEENGNVKIDVTAYIPPKESIKKISFAANALNSSNIFLYHKTTHREVYRNAAEQIKNDNVNDVILYNEKNQVTESTICNIVIEKNGKLFTPPVECGLLNGTFRQSLIDQKVIREKIILKSDIKKADKIYLINSVQQWAQATFINQF